MKGRNNGMKKLDDELLLIDLETLMRITGYGRRRALKIAELAQARVYIGNSLRFNVQKLKEFLYKEAI